MFLIFLFKCIFLCVSSCTQSEGEEKPSSYSSDGEAKVWNIVLIRYMIKEKKIKEIISLVLQTVFP